MPEVVTIGETMLRLAAPPGLALEQAPHFTVVAAGAESNVAVALSRLGTSAGWISRLVDNPLGRRIAAEVRAHGVDVSRVLWTSEGRIGTYFFEPGAPPRLPRVIYDRAHSAFAQIDPDEVDWAYVAEARLVHLTGITPALGEACRRLTGRAIAEARRSRIPVCFDVNYRARLWTPEQARAALEPLLEGLDILICTREDATVLLDGTAGQADAAPVLQRRFRTRLAVVTDGTRCAAAAQDGTTVVREGHAIEPVDRMGAGDAFAAGFIHGYLREGVEAGLTYGMAAAALKHTYYGDVAWISPEDVRRLLAGERRWR